MDQRHERIVRDVVAEVERAASVNAERANRVHPHVDEVMRYIESAIPRILDRLHELSYPNILQLQNRVPRGPGGFLGWKIQTKEGWRIGSTQYVLPFKEHPVEMPIYLMVDGELRSSGSTMTPQSFAEIGQLDVLHGAIKAMVAKYSVGL